MFIIRILRKFTKSRTGRGVVILALVALVTGLGSRAFYHEGLFSMASAQTQAVTTAEKTLVASVSATTNPSTEQLGNTLVRLASHRVETRPVQHSSWSGCLRLTGRLELNESRLAHVSSLVEGVVREVRVELGESVQVGDVLAYIDSREVGEAKLQLVKDRLALDYAEKMHTWHQTIHDNTMALLAALEDGMAIGTIQTEFRERPIGEYRQQLVTALSRLNQAQADFERIDSLGRTAVIAGKQVIRAKSELESAQAAYRSLVEQVRFDAQQQRLQAQQRLHQAKGAAAISRSHLLVLGYRTDDIEQMDPIAEGERVAYYPVRSPIAGTVIDKHAPLSQHVNAQSELLEIADLSTIWLQADIFEKDMAAVTGLEGRKITFTTNSYPGSEFAATVFTVGHQVHDQSRAARLLAVVNNRERQLKPGMFVETRITNGEKLASWQVETSAIQRHGGATFVFVRRTDGQYERRDVQIGRSNAERVEVTVGLVGSEQVVTQGGFALKSNMLSELMTEE